MKIKIKLFYKLALSFLIAILSTLLIVMLLSNIMIQDRFNTYVHDMHNEGIDKIVNFLKIEYDKNHSLLKINKNELAGYAKFQNLYIKITDANGKTLFDTGKSFLHDKSLLGPAPKVNIKGVAPQGQDKYIEESKKLNFNGNFQGTLIMGYYRMDVPSRQAFTFKNKIINILPVSGIIAISIGILISLILSKQLAVPIHEVTKTAHKIRKGNYKERSEIKTNTEEFQDLSNSINCLAETLDTQETLRKRLVTDISHEIRTPLTTLQNYLEAFFDGYWEPTNERLKSCYEEILRLKTLVENLKFINNIEQSNIDIEKSKFNLTEEIIKIAELFKPQCSKKNISFELNLEPDINVEMDKNKIGQILNNLLSNAYRYTNDNGSIKISLKKSENIIITIEDNGIGISKDDLPYIFERLYRADISRSRETGGYGIGLSIVKALVEAQGGRIEVESELNKGTKFKLIF